MPAAGPAQRARPGEREVLPGDGPVLERGQLRPIVPADLVVHVGEERLVPPPVRRDLLRHPHQRTLGQLVHLGQQSGQDPVPLGPGSAGRGEHHASGDHDMSSGNNGIGRGEQRRTPDIGLGQRLRRILGGPTVGVMPKDAALTVTDLVVRFGGVTALAGVSFTVRAARSVG
jgi:hypothetical protein